MARFFIDECLPFEVTLAFRGAGHDATDIVERGLRGIADDAVWTLAASEQRILVTRDLDFPLRIEGSRPVGLLLIRGPDTMTAAQLGTVVAELLASSPEVDFENAIVVLSPGRYRRRPWPQVQG